MNIRRLPSALDFSSLTNDSSIYSNRSPSTCIKETDDVYLIELSAPKYKKEKFKIKLDENVLSISNDQKYTKEIYSPSFFRKFSLPRNIDGKINSKYENGILKIEIPKKENSKNLRLIEIE